MSILRPLISGFVATKGLSFNNTLQEYEKIDYNPIANENTVKVYLQEKKFDKKLAQKRDKLKSRDRKEHDKRVLSTE